MASLMQKLVRWCWRKQQRRQPLKSKALAPAQHKLIKVTECLPALYRFSPPIVRILYHGLEYLFSIDKPVIGSVVDYQLTSSGHDQKPDDIGVRAYCAKPLQSGITQPTLVYFHGGGCVFGSIDTHDNLCRYISRNLGCIVLSVNYRLAPEYKFPIPLEDAIDAWNWIHQHAEVLGVDTDNLGVGGDSAGGYLATSIALQYLTPTLNCKPNAMPAYQWLLYPMLDLRGATDSYQQCSEGMLLTSSLMAYLSTHYLHHDEQRIDPVASPGLCESLDGLPPTYVMTVEHDPLRDEGKNYVNRLIQNSNIVAHDHVLHCMHGFIAVTGICPDAREALKLAVRQLSKLQQQSNKIIK